MKNVVYLILYCFAVAVKAHSDLYTVINENDVACISNDKVTPIFISPPNENGEISVPNLIEVATWINDDWNVKKSPNFIENVTLDKRFEDFKTIRSKNLTFLFPVYISFSVYGKKNLMFVSPYNDVTLKLKNTSTETADGWTHFLISCKDDNVNFMQNEKSIGSWENFVPKKLQVFGIEGETFFKIHEYKLKWANQITTKKPTQLKIPATSSSFLVLYFSLCKNCILEFSVNENEIQTFSSTQELWQRHEIPIEPHKETELRFWRRNNESNEGSWSIDIRLGAEVKNNYFILRNKYSNVTNNIRCKFLTKSYDDGNKDADFLSLDGKLNKDITCKDILGAKFPHCERHKICKNSKCECAWGYYGPTCNTSCPTEKWGPSCRYDCKCKNCNKVTGLCKWSEAQICGIGIAIFVVLAVLLVVLCNVKKIQRRTDNYYPGIFIKY